MPLTNSLKITPLTTHIGGLVEDVDLSQPQSDDMVADIRAALLDRKVLFFENQNITPRRPKPSEKAPARRMAMARLPVVSDSASELVAGLTP